MAGRKFPVQATELAGRLQAGVSAIIYTDIDQDGMMQGVNVEATLDGQGEFNADYASGGISTWTTSACWPGIPVRASRAPSPGGPFMRERWISEAQAAADGLTSFD